MKTTSLESPPYKLRVFFPTRFHIFDQLSAPIFDAERSCIEIYSIYPPRYFRNRKYPAIAPINHTLWLGLVMWIMMRGAVKLGLRGKLIRHLRTLYIAACALEFRLRTHKATPRIIMASAGYLGRQATSLQQAGHLIAINHGGLYEPWVRTQMLALNGTEKDSSENWAHPKLNRNMQIEFETADTIILCSPTAAAKFPKTLKQKIRIVPLGAPPNTARTSPHSHKGTRFLHISNLSFLKNVNHLLDAFDKIRSPDDKLIIGGPQPRDPILRRRLTSNEAVHWIGKLDRSGVIAAMNQADIFVHPSYADGWGMVVTEALSSGLTIVASPFTGAATYYESLSDLGAASILLPDPSDPNAIACSMRAMRDKRQKDPTFTPIVPMSWAESATILAEALHNKH